MNVNELNNAQERMNSHHSIVVSEADRAILYFVVCACRSACVSNQRFCLDDIQILSPAIQFLQP